MTAVRQSFFWKNLFGHGWDGFHGDTRIFFILLSEFDVELTLLLLGRRNFRTGFCACL